MLSTASFSIHAYNSLSKRNEQQTTHKEQRKLILSKDQAEMHREMQFFQVKTQRYGTKNAKRSEITRKKKQRQK